MVDADLEFFNIVTEGEEPERQSKPADDPTVRFQWQTNQGGIVTPIDDIMSLPRSAIEQAVHGSLYRRLFKLDGSLRYCM